MKNKGKKVPRLFMYLYILALILLVIWIGFTGQNSFFKRMKLKKQLEKLEIETQRLKAVNDSLRAENDRLISNPEAAEKAAREEFGLTKPGEKVFRFVPAKEDQ